MSKNLKTVYQVYLFNCYTLQGTDNTISCHVCVDHLCMHRVSQIKRGQCSFFRFKDF